MLYLETALSPLHIFTAEMHFRYIQKVVTMPEHRLPRILANYLVQELKQQVIEWETLAETYGERLQLGDPSQWSQWAKSILAHMKETYRTQFKTKSRRRTTRMTHRSLKYDLGVDNYFTDAFTVENDHFHGQERNPPTKLYPKYNSITKSINFISFLNPFLFI